MKKFLQHPLQWMMKGSVIIAFFLHVCCAWAVESSVSEALSAQRSMNLSQSIGLQVRDLTITPQQARSGQEVEISGRVVKVYAGHETALAYFPLNIELHFDNARQDSEQFETFRHIVFPFNIQSDAAGYFELHYTPTGRMAGRFGVYIVAQGEHVDSQINEHRQDAVFAEMGSFVATGEAPLQTKAGEGQAWLQWSTKLETGLKQGENRIEHISLRNPSPYQATGLRVEMSPNNQHNWLTLASTLPEVLDAKSEIDLDLNINPPATAREGVYLFDLTLFYDEGKSQNMHVQVSITNSENGNARLRIEDNYTGYQGEGGNDGLSDALVVLTNDQVKTFVKSATSDANGNVNFDDLPAGFYQYRASADGHESKSGTLWVQPGIDNEERIFLNNQFVSVKWQVSEITIDDEYDLYVDATWETDVPAPVLVVDPPVYKLPALKKGETHHGVFKIGNAGLININELKASLPASDQYLKFEFMRDAIPDTIHADQMILLPFTVTALRDLDYNEEELDAMSGKSTVSDPSSEGTENRTSYMSKSQCTCTTRFFYSKSIEIEGEYICANGDEQGSSGRSQIVFAASPRSFPCECSTEHKWGSGSTAGGFGGGWGMGDRPTTGGDYPPLGLPGCRPDHPNCGAGSAGGGGNGGGSNPSPPSLGGMSSTF